MPYTLVLRRYLPEHVVVQRPHVAYFVDFDEYIEASDACDRQAIPQGYAAYSEEFLRQVERIVSRHKINSNIKNLIED